MSSSFGERKLVVIRYFIHMIPLCYCMYFVEVEGQIVKISFELIALRFYHGGVMKKGKKRDTREQPYHNEEIIDLLDVDIYRLSYFELRNYVKELGDILKAFVCHLVADPIFVPLSLKYGESGVIGSKGESQNSGPNASFDAELDLEPTHEAQENVSNHAPAKIHLLLYTLLLLQILFLLLIKLQPLSILIQLLKLSIILLIQLLTQYILLLIQLLT
ncbi:hypothetical protein H5410_041820 [Solanum commersonii]|uniref:PB1-like domain-containing protein n=1 Tax=Solanum commersonii TaxID=4109 RepID=A0A9J5XU79_SOLCO|nr:hypothetical protein H5410_041820 [Solanum commersonii]